MIRERELVALIVVVIGGVALTLVPRDTFEIGDAAMGGTDSSMTLDTSNDTTTCSYVDACAGNGSAGCPGDPGTAGLGGGGAGASVPLFVSGGSVTIRGGALITGSGGIGGSGGAGGTGGAGMMGDSGADIFCDPSCGTPPLTGGGGGFAGPGGSGGQGGGGAGGPACYYAVVGATLAFDASPQEILEGDGGAGGSPNGPAGAFKPQCP